MALFSFSREEQIIRQFRKGNPRAMDSLYAEYADYLTAVCALYVPNKEDLHDVLQESFIKIFTAIGSFDYRGKGSLKAWVTRVCINEALQFLRNTNPNIFTDSDIEQINIAEEEPETDSLTDEQIAELIGQLPPGYRAVFNLYVIEGKSHKQIAQMLGIKPDTSASQLHKAKTMLAQMINEKKRRNDNG